MGRKKKIAIVRGPSLSKWEMQIYEPLRKKFHLLGVGAMPQVNDTEGIAFPCVFLPLRFGVFQRIPKYTYVMNKFLGDTRWLAGFDEAIANYDVLHSVELRTGFTLQAVRAKQKGVVKTVTVTVYENVPFVSDDLPARLRLKHEVLSSIDHFFAANEEARQALLAEGAAEKKISIIPQSVDTTSFKPKQKNAYGLSLRRRFRLNKEDFVVLSVGRMVWEKGWYEIVRCAYYIKLKTKNLKQRNIRFLCVGDGPELKNLKNMVSRLGLENVVIFTGEMPYREMPHYFNIADLFVLASIPTKIWNEQFGGVLIEAMAAGLPIIGTTNGGIVSTVGESGGIFVPPQDFVKIADGILSFCKDQQGIQKIGRRNREVAVHCYDVNKVAQSIGKIWNSLI